MTNVADMKKAIDDRLQAKKHYVSADALQAKELFSGASGRQVEAEQTEMSSKRYADLMAEFNVSIQLLMRIFKESKFDSVLGFVGNPLRLMVLNLMMGIFRGIGFVFGVLVVSYVFYRVYEDGFLRLFSAFS